MQLRERERATNIEQPTENTEQRTQSNQRTYVRVRIRVAFATTSTLLVPLVMLGCCSYCWCRFASSSPPATRVIPWSVSNRTEPKLNSSASAASIPLADSSCTSKCGFSLFSSLSLFSFFLLFFSLLLSLLFSLPLFFFGLRCVSSVWHRSDQMLVLFWRQVKRVISSILKRMTQPPREAGKREKEEGDRETVFGHIFDNQKATPGYWTHGTAF